jgi:hypothetical protein
VRRYADLLSAMLVLTRDFPHPDVLGVLAGLRDDVFALLDRLAAALPSGGDARERDRKRRVFLMVNLDLIVGLARDKELGGAEVAWLEERMESEVGSFVAEQLLACFGPLATAAKSAKLPSDKEAVEALLRNLHKSWKADVQRLVDAVMQKGGFSNFSLAGAVCRKMLLELTKVITSSLCSSPFSFYGEKKGKFSCLGSGEGSVWGKRLFKILCGTVSDSRRICFRDERSRIAFRCVK